MLSLVVCVALSSAFVPPASLTSVSRVAVSPSAEMVSMAAKKNFFGGPASPTKPKVTQKAKPLSPGSNYPSTRNIQRQSNGFGNFVQKFQKASGKSKYGMPIFLPNGSINPKYLAAERADMAAQAKRSVTAEAGKRAKMKKAGTYELGDFIKKKIGNVGSGKEYYQSGR